MKIKLMFIALVVTSGLQGSDRGQMVSVNGEDTLALALTRCIESESYRFDEKTFVQKKCKRPVIIHFYSDKDDKYSSLTKIEDLVAGSLKANFVNAFAELLTIHLISDTEDKKDDRICGDSRLNACLFYNITSDKKSMDDHVCRIKQLLDLNKQIPLLVNINIDVTDSTNIIEELGEEAEIVNHKQVLDHIIDKNGSLDELLKRSEELTFDSKVFRSKSNEKKQDGYISIFSNFFTNHWGKLAGVSLMGILAYYYKVTR